MLFPQIVSPIQKPGSLGKLFLILVVLISIQPGSAAIFLQNGTKISQDQVSGIAEKMKAASTGKISMDFFYSSQCRSCQGALDHIRAFEKKNSPVHITYYNLAGTKETHQTFTQYKSRFNITKISYPAVFIGDLVISGSSDIIYTVDPFFTSDTANG